MIKNYIIDSHCHLDYFDYHNEINDVINRASKNNIKKMLTICTNPANLDLVKNISEKYEQIFFAAGQHPLNLTQQNKFTEKDLLEISKHPKMIGIGETGLDYHYSVDNKKDQKKFFEWHISVSQETKIPLIVHSRSADMDMIDILKKKFYQKSFNCVMHCFSSGEKLAEEVINLDFYISISGIITFKGNDKLINIIKQIPKNRILIETDCPYLSPSPLRGKKNEPSHLIHTSKYISEILKIDENEFNNLTSSNFYRLFKKVKKYEKKYL